MLRLELRAAPPAEAAEFCLSGDIMGEKFAAPLPANLPRADIEALAALAAERLGYAPGGDIFAAAERLGGRIRLGSLTDREKQSGSLVAKALSDWTIYLSAIETAARDRFAIAQNIGHLMLHLPLCRQLNPQAVMRAPRFAPQAPAQLRRAKWEAAWFALALLMPAAEFAALFKEAGKATCGLRFGVSGLAVRARAQSLGLGVFL